ncbi:uncharacterized protein LOC120493455 [Pimephales promelas]|uniref:uncharacterized protein LOC120493455 n=1 Tax=Pimephales promelas TaxID=90988 RepID=UPI001955A901|nr:uncharacterized protein LOC120493455 [Pimephales promelas]
MSAEIPQNRTVVETSLSPKTDSLGSQSVGSVVQHHQENLSICQQPPMSESDHSFPSKSVRQEGFEEQRRSEICRDACQPAQHKMSKKVPQENPGQNELLLQRQVKQLQRVLQEQNTLLSLISPGLILSPTFLAHWQAQTPPSTSEADLNNTSGNLDPFKESSTKPSYSGQVENKSEAPLASNNTNDVVPSAELRCLFAIEEESPEPAQDDCPLSPFGLRQGLPPNPEERPIRPGLREEQKTFEEFVEEHLKTDQAVLQYENEASTQLKGAEKRNFLRKGEGTSKISKVKDCSLSLKRRCSVSSQIMNMKPSQPPVRPTEEIPNGSNPALKGVGNLSDQKPGLKKTIALQVDDYLSNNKGKVKALTANTAINAVSLKSKRREGVVKNYGRTNGSKPSGSAPAQSRSVGFKKVNDHIVKIHEKNYHQREHTKEVHLMDEVMESLALSESNDSTCEDGPNSQPHSPFPHYLSRHTDHKDQSLDLSDGDYASDAPSEIQFNEEHSSTPTSSCSSFSSDSELKSLEGSMAKCSKKTEERRTPVILDHLLLLTLSQRHFQKSRLLQKTSHMAWRKRNHILQSGLRWKSMVSKERMAANLSGLRVNFMNLRI